MLQFLFILAVCILLFCVIKSSRELFVSSVHECDLLKRHLSAQESGLFFKKETLTGLEMTESKL